MILTLDRSKNKHAVKEFNAYTTVQLKSQLNQKVPLKIYRENSQELHELQAADLFAWGIFRKHEKNGLEWYKLFSKHIKTEQILQVNENEPVSSNVLSCGQPQDGGPY